jgi:hypothetical protein
MALVQMNASYLDPNGAFQKRLLESFKESIRDDTKAMVESLRQEHTQRMLELEQQYGAKYKELSAKEESFKVHLEVKERETMARFEKLQVSFLTIDLGQY